MKRPLYNNSVFRVVPARTWWQERSDTGLCPSALSSTASSFTSSSTAAAHDGEKLVKIVRFLIKQSEFQLKTQKLVKWHWFTFSDHALIWQDFSPLFKTLAYMYASDFIRTFWRDFHHRAASAAAASTATEDTTRSSEQSPQWRHCHARWSRPTPSPPPATRRALPLLKYNRAINMSECFRCGDGCRGGLAGGGAFVAAAGWSVGRSARRWPASQPAGRD